MSKKNIKNKNMVNGVLAENKDRLSLDELLSEPIMNPFRTMSLSSFENRLDEMDLMDMERLATEVDLRPVHDRRLMKERLIKQFKVRVAKIKHSEMLGNQKNKNTPLPSEKAKVAESIMREGR